MLLKLIFFSKCSHFLYFLLVYFVCEFFCDFSGAKNTVFFENVEKCFEIFSSTHIRIVLVEKGG